jgi:hypothetical protein
VTSAEETQMITTVPIRNNPALYLKPMRKKNEMNNTQMGKSAEIVEIHTFSASARSQNQ